MTAPHRIVLDNGLRVLLSPRPGAPAVAVAVHYDVGFRSEPEGRGGFSHLFEHLMFQGSDNHPKMAHWNYVQGLGGIINGSTHQDYTDYFQLLPSNGLEKVLAMEAGRMTNLRVTEENLDNQRSVVKEEIRSNVLNRAYGGFPWIPLPALLYRTYPNAHNGYGDFADLDATGVSHAVDFYRAHYTPANAVLTIRGDLNVPRAASLVERYFGPLPRRPRPAPAPLDEPPPSATLRGSHKDPHAPMPAVAVGYRLPDPRSELDAYLAWMTLCEVLTGGTASVLHTSLVREHGVAVHVSAGCGLFNSLDARAPDTLALVATHRPDTDADLILGLVDRELERLADARTLEDRTRVARSRLATRLARRNADLLASTRALGAYELLYGRPGLLDELPGRVTAVRTESVRQAVGHLRSPARAVLSLLPGSTDRTATEAVTARKAGAAR
ncbi:M16 family metallopeptidase [Streptomyces sp. SudanB91_2054]|uniref:M16 family metallopeptidase n=1 Tax=Streptomyces sp. SudanB91_2054 TaxID=3035278 RepID=UPI0036DEA254